MKLFLILVLCGATCCLASPKRSKRAVQSCSIGFNDDTLQGYCSLVRCWMNFYIRCEKSLFGPYFPHREFQKMLSTICVKGNPLQKKYYDNLKCIASFLQGGERKDFNCSSDETTKEEMCKKLPDKVKCTSDYIAKICGEDAGHVSQVAVALFIVYTFSGCIPAFEI